MSNLIDCVECGHGVSQKASCCPKCQTKKFKGVKCEACKETLKVSEAISVIMTTGYRRKEESHSIKEVSLPGKDISLNNWDSRNERYCKFHQKCLDSINEEEIVVLEKKEVFDYECSSCSSKFKLELYSSQARDGKTCKTCGEPHVVPENISQLRKRLKEEQAKLEDSRTSCFNCELPVIKSKGIKIFSYEYKGDDYKTVHKYVHQVCLSEEFLKSKHYLELKDFIQLEKKIADMNRKYEIELITKAIIKYLLIISCLISCVIIVYLLLR
jgi:hypothetical protein